MNKQYILLDHGSGGRASQELISELFLRYFDNPILGSGDDAAKLSLCAKGNNSASWAISTDAYTLSPLCLGQTTIGDLAVNGTINDVAMLGAIPRYLTCAFIIEEGLPFAQLEHIVKSMAKAAKKANVLIVSGDTKVVPRGACDGLFICTTGLGEIIANPAPSGSLAQVGDAIILSGQIGEHGLAVLGARQDLPFLSAMHSDCAPLHEMIEALVEKVGDIHVLRDPTRGGLASTLNEIAMQSQIVCHIHEETIPIRGEVQAACDILGLDPFTLANEGKLVCFVPKAKQEEALAIIKSSSYGKDAAIIGEVFAPRNKADDPKQKISTKAGQVLLHTRLGGTRLLPMLEGDPLPRIC